MNPVEPKPPAARDVIALTSEPIDPAALTAGVHDAAAGGVCVFLGTTRSEEDVESGRLLSLDYEAYPEMAMRQLQDLARQARERWPIVHLALVHRTGRVPLAEPSVLIAVSTPHRGEAFKACRWLIDTLKAELAVWKKEIWEKGEGTWARANNEWHGGGSGDSE